MPPKGTKGSSRAEGSGNGDSFYNSLVQGDVDVPDDKVIDEIFAERTTQHADDAIDYEDIDELADENEDEVSGMVIEESKEAGMPAEGLDDEQELQNKANDQFDAFFGDDDDEEKAAQSDHFDHMDGADMDMLGDMNNQFGFEDDGLNDLNLGFEDELGHEHTMKASEPSRKRKSPQELAQKKAKLQKIVADMESRHKARMVAKYYPEYSPSKPVNFHTMSLPAPKYYNHLRPAIAFRSNVKPLIPMKLSMEVEPDQKKAFKSKRGVINDASQKKGIVQITQADLDLIEDLERNGDTSVKVKVLPFISSDGIEYDKFAEFSKDLVLASTDWDDDAIIDAGDKDKMAKPSRPGISTDKFVDDDIDYDDENIFNGQVAPDKFELNMNDPNLLFVPDKKKTDTAKSRAVIPTDKKQLQLKFNVSNDKQYEILRNNYNTKVRSQLSNLTIEHSVPALRLQTPYYKIRLSKEEARAYHRAKFQVRQGSLICFSKPKVRKKKKDKGKTQTEIFSKTSDLTAADTAPLIAMEYCEEYPNILSNFGMSSKVINYYRKEKEDDNSRPKAPIGETHVLGVEDRSPFWNFGHVAKGDFVPTLYNNMIRAPIFKQEPKSTDFLLIRSSGCGNHQRHYLRAINNLFAVGNVFPAVEVPAPHSRKVTNTSKNRLKMIVYRTMNKNGNARLSVKDISSHFPDQNDMQNRQRLKEFMEYQRKGDDQGFWKIKNMDVVPTEEEIRAMITPEDVALLDSMQHGSQVLDDIDSLYNDDSRKQDLKREKREKENGKDAEEENEEKEKAERKRREKDGETDETIDEGLSPWSLSRSFIIANQTKAMLQLNGEGDNSGIGLGFSFLRATQKHGFKPLFPPPKESVPKNTTAAYQQKLYENEISRIWYSQRSSLTVDNREGHTLDDIYKEYKPLDHVEYMKQKFAKEKEDKVKQEGVQSARRNVLKITRLVRDENNVVQRRVEYVTDPRLIKAYIKRKKQIEGDKMSMVDANEILPTNDIEMNKIRRKALEEKIANLQKRAKLSKGRKPSKDPLHLAAAAGGTIIDANTVMLPDGSYAFGGKGIGKGKSRTRRCKSCGVFGHIKTNKKCPLYEATKGGSIRISAEQKDIIMAEYRSKEGGGGGGSGHSEPPSSTAQSSPQPV
ncbi:hypothetical protein ACI3LY_005119 [Candidozyma auris]|uniref:Transcription initiation factor TFIID subunit 1 histone acetyltransferase domain-containing protein n=2 Tax=Candidozyma auris TaxID=498019 RepID=A0AB36W7C9_CANAR|nr:hypothetical protein QG37_05811 [[Candida] auris]PIS54507.1 hypothetical protein B9J08_002281 [[Candida] auris]PIS55131.1 hypothetical protein CJI97_001824 [[Candida] auris]QWW25948.1 hypothetical protein CA7LBN_004852 [[Candida] auris]